MRSFFLFSCSLFLVACEADEKFAETEAFQNVPSEQHFTINAERDTILFGEEGVRLFLPANSFTYGNGNQVVGEIDIYLIEALSITNQLMMDATGENQLGIVRIEAKKENTALVVRPKAKLLLQFPAKGLDGNFSLQSGYVKRNGKIRWRKGEKNASFLIPEAFSRLPFHPKEFAEELTAVLPFGEFQEYSIGLADSLYMRFTFWEPKHIQIVMRNQLWRKQSNYSPNIVQIVILSI